MYKSTTREKFTRKLSVRLVKPGLMSMPPGMPATGAPTGPYMFTTTTLSVSNC